MIRLESVSKRFRNIEALAALDLEIRRGERLAIVGRNGSGKTSLLRILVGLSRPTTGRVLLDGKPPAKGDWLAFRRRVGYMPERIQFHENLTGRKTLAFFARLRGLGNSEILPLLERVGLCTAADRKVGDYSKGMVQRLNLAQALLGDPEVLILDEPIEGFDAHAARQFFELARSAAGRTVIFSSHRLPGTTAAVDRILVLREGRLAALGSERDLRRRLQLPFRVTVHSSAESRAGLLERLRRLCPEGTLVQNGAIVMSVPQAEKIAFLSRLDSLDGAIRDLHIEEPSLEEVLLETS